ncbi:MAG: hypothetical protein RLZZ316_2553, partial [Bacteroidota bacterium]
MRVTKKLLKVLFVIIGALVVLYVVGPNPSTPIYGKEWPAIPASSALLETYIKNNEAAHRLKPNNEARIVWNNDSLKNKTPYAIVYLHGFSASQEEGNPV